MQSKYLHQLPAPVRSLVDEIERAAGVEIAVIHRPDFDIEQRASMRGGGPLIPTIEYGERFDSTSPIYHEPYMMPTHELLHLRRWVVDGVAEFQVSSAPCFRAASGNRLATFGFLPNVLEHLVIERQLQLYGFSPPDYSTLRNYWESVGLSHPPNFWDRWQTLLCWAETDILASDEAVRHLAEHVLREGALWEIASWFSGELRWLIESPDRVTAKLGMIAISCAALQVPKSRIVLEHYGGGVRTKAEMPRAVMVPGHGGASRLFALVQC